MSNKKKIPCRVCGKLFEPCSYCQSHNDVFRWRNFACSRECATNYINNTLAYRESLKNTEEINKTFLDDGKSSKENNTPTKKKSSVKKSEKSLHTEKNNEMNILEFDN